MAIAVYGVCLVLLIAVCDIRAEDGVVVERRSAEAAELWSERGGKRSAEAAEEGPREGRRSAEAAEEGPREGKRSAEAAALWSEREKRSGEHYGGGHYGGGHYGGGHYGGGHYGGGHYGGGGGHYAIGFSEEELNKICKEDTGCYDCFNNSQPTVDNKRTLKLGDSQECVSKYLTNNAWASQCVAYGKRMRDNGNDNENIQHMYSFCLRSASEFFDSEKCDSKQDWGKFLDCFTGEGRGTKKPESESGEE